jgi:solute carrier family 25 phosphate transporter 3
MGDKHDVSYYLKCMAGGALACGLTHTAIVPLDVVKCRRQIDPTLYKSLGDGLSTIRVKEGFGGLSLVPYQLLVILGLVPNTYRLQYAGSRQVWIL